MALDQVDLANLSTAIENAISRGFSTAFPPGRTPGTPGGGTGTPPPPLGTPAQSPPGSPTGGTGGSTAVPTAPTAIASASTAEASGGATYAGVQQGSADKAIQNAKALVDSSEAGLARVVELQENLYVKGYRDLIQDFGGEIRKITQEDFIRGDFGKVLNKGSEASLKVFRNMSLGYAKDLNKFEGLRLEDQMRNSKQMVKTFGDTNANLLIGSNETLEKHLQMFKTSMNIEMSEAAKLIAVSFAETGKVTDDILKEITNNAASVGKAVGVSTKVMAEGIRELKTDMDTFTDITVASAARIVGTLSQVGLTLGSFTKILGDYRGFDSAADKIGDLSATFGIQMDAMEMMYLANEDEEQFLHRMRDQILDQGIDIESMSKTRQRALADQMGMTVKEMKQFLNTGMLVTDQTELQTATQEASTQTQVDAVKTLEEGLVITSKSLADARAQTQELQSAFSALSLSKFVGSVGEGQAEMQKLETTGNRLAQAVITTQSEIALLTSTLAGGFADVLKGINPSNNGADITSAWESIVKIFSLTGEASILEMSTGLNNAIKESPLGHSSWPAAFGELASALGANLKGEPNEQMTFYQNTIKQWGDTLSSSIQEALKNINSSFDFSEVSANFQKAASIVSEGAQSLGIETATTGVAPARVATASTDNPSLKAITSSIQTISEKIDSMPTEVNVKVDIQSIKSDIVNAIMSGFEEANYSFNMFVDREQIATVISKSTTAQGKTFSMVAPS